MCSIRRPIRTVGGHVYIAHGVRERLQCGFNKGTFREPREEANPEGSQLATLAVHSALAHLKFARKF